MSWVDSNSDLSCENAEVFVQNLTSLAVQFANLTDTQSLRFLYRGVSDVSHRLVPTALRTEEEHPKMYKQLWEIADSRGRPAVIDKRNMEIAQRRAELTVIQHFYQYAERAGLSLPVVSNENIRQELLTGRGTVLEMATHGTSFSARGTEVAVWPPTELLPIFGLLSTMAFQQGYWIGLIVHSFQLILLQLEQCGGYKMVKIRTLCFVYGTFT